MRSLPVYALALSALGGAFSFSKLQPLNRVASLGKKNTQLQSGTLDSPSATKSTADDAAANRQRRRLGSQENLMLPRQYSPNEDVIFPQMNHVSCAILSATPSEKALEAAIEYVMTAHPLLQCKIEGDGEPTERIDLFQMVRKGDPNPCTFVSEPGTCSAKDVIRFIDVDGDSRSSLDKSWQSAFNRDLDNGDWCKVETSPLWKVELHRLAEGENSPCALLFSFNHAISDQGSATRLTDQIVSLLAEFDSKGSINKVPTTQKIPLSVEQSVLGEEQTFEDVNFGGFSPQTAAYVAGKALEETKSPVILPDGFSQGGGALGALTTISGNAAGGENADSSKRRSVVEFRTLSQASSEALLKACRENGVSVSNALSAALTLTSTDFVDGGKGAGKERNYKVLQSLDMRRFGEALDKGESVGCLAGSMDLMHGPLPDKSGLKLRSNPSKKGLTKFWDLAREGRSQTGKFIESDGPKDAVRVFDFAMTISDMNNLVHLTSESKDSQGRAYSAGFTNAGVYEKSAAFRNEDEPEKSVEVSIIALR